MNKEIEEIVKFDFALNLKKIGFDYECFSYFWDNGKFKTGMLCDYNNRDSRMISAPTLYQVQKWLRNTHQIYIEVLTDCTTEPKFCFKIDKFVGNPEDLSDREWYWIHHTDFEWFLYYIYEQALEEAIKEAIKII